jgi:hypothetical protein
LAHIFQLHDLALEPRGEEPGDPKAEDGCDYETDRCESQDPVPEQPTHAVFPLLITLTRKRARDSEITI